MLVPTRRRWPRAPSRRQTENIFILNGEKLWCTNGTKAGVIVVMAKTPPKIVKGKSKDQITAFIVETNWPGVEVHAPLPFHGVAGALQRRHPFQERPRAA